MAAFAVAALPLLALASSHAPFVYLGSSPGGLTATVTRGDCHSSGLNAEGRGHGTLAKGKNAGGVCRPTA